MYAANVATYQYHALGKKDLHVCLLRDKVFNNITKNREADQISYCESERHLVGMHRYVNAGLLGLRDEGVLSPNCKETHENRSAGVPSENAWCSSILRVSGRLVVVQHLLRGITNLGGGRSLQGSISAHIGAILWFRDAVWAGLGVSRGVDGSMQDRCGALRRLSFFVATVCRSLPRHRSGPPSGTTCRGPARSQSPMPARSLAFHHSNISIISVVVHVHVSPQRLGGAIGERQRKH